MSLQLNKFNIKKLNKHVGILIIGQRNAGKTHLTQHIMNNKKNHYFTIITHKYNEPNTSIFYDSYSSYLSYKDFNNSITYNEYDENIIKNVLDDSVKVVKLKDKITKKDDNKRIKYTVDNNMLILDDCITSKIIRNDNMSELFFNHRHFNLSFIMCLQYPLHIPPEYRTNFDYIFMLNNNIRSTKKRIYEQYAGMFSTFEEFEHIFDDITNEDHKCLVIDQTIYTKNMNEKIFWYKVD
jgi:AAA+ ATPase superfamily predicted ATPase